MKKLSITSRELQILQYVSDEFTTTEIAQQLFLSRHTVISHRKHLLAKMGARNTAGLVRRGFEMGILVLE